MNAPTTFAPTALGATTMGHSALEVAPSHPLATVEVAAGAPAQYDAPLELPNNFPVPLTGEQQAGIAARVAAFDFLKLHTRDVPKLGLSAELELGKALDSFLARINQQGNPALFRLTDELTNHFEDAKLEQVADRILNAKPGLVQRIIGLFSKKFARSAIAKAWEDVSRMASGRSKTLSDHVNAIQKKLEGEMAKLGIELTNMDKVKDAYRANLVSFAIETAVLHNSLLKARFQFAQAEEELKKDPQAYQDAQDKLQALESRALAVEGGLTKLPADQIVIRQLQNAGIGTLQELSTTMSSRFNSIKGELLVIHGALAVQGVQRLGQQGAALDANLGKVRGKLMKDVVLTAATMPGQNRAQQANQLKALVEQSRELQTITVTAREENKRQFDEARTTLANVRKELLDLGLSVNPGQPVTGAF